MSLTLCVQCTARLYGQFHLSLRSATSRTFLLTVSMFSPKILSLTEAPRRWYHVSPDLTDGVHHLRGVNCRELLSAEDFTNTREGIQERFFTVSSRSILASQRIFTIWQALSLVSKPSRGLDQCLRRHDGFERFSGVIRGINLNCRLSPLWSALNWSR